MYEVEVKVAAEREAVRERLPERAEPLGTVVQVDTYFDAPHRTFAETDEALRLRRERPVDDGEWTTAITYKGPLLEAESKTREEFETLVHDGEALEAALERLGFEPAAEVRKEREQYEVDESAVSLDAVEGLGEFVEVEIEVVADPDDPTDADDPADADEAIAEPREAARSILAELGCDPDEQIRTSYLGLLLEEGDAGDEAEE